MWADESPSLTPCFHQTVLIWTPCLFLWLYSILDIKWRLNSRYSHIPWTLLNITKFLILFVLIGLQIADLTFLILHNNAHDGFIYTAQFVAVGVKLVTFVSL